MSSADKQHTTTQYWLAESVRLTAFPASSDPLDHNDWWMGVVGEPPESETTRLREAVVQKQSGFGPGQLSLIVQPLRIQWQLTPPEPPVLSPDHPLSIGSLEDASKHMKSLAKRWFGQSACPDMMRLAVGIVLKQPAPDYATAMSILMRYLPSVGLEPEAGTDFLYQINRPRLSKSGPEGLRINRLSRWSVAQWQVFQILPPPAPSHAVPAGLDRSLYAQADLDVNTAADFGHVFRRDQLSVVFDELWDLVTELANEGDRP